MLKTKNQKKAKLPKEKQSAVSKIMIQPVSAEADHDPAAKDTLLPGPQPQKMQQSEFSGEKGGKRSISSLLIAPLEDSGDYELAFPSSQHRQLHRHCCFMISTPAILRFQRIRAGPIRGSPFSNKNGIQPFRRQQPQPAQSWRSQYA